MTSSNPDRLDELFTSVESTLIATWELISSHSPNLHDLPSQLQQTLTDVMDRISNQGTLPLLPSFKDLTTPSTPAPPPPPPPPPPSHALVVTTLQKHPYLFTAILSTTLGTTAYYLYPSHTTRFLSPLISPLRPYTPLFLLPTSNRPLRITMQGGGGQEIRKEAVLILGCSPEGVMADMALEFEQRGFVVICTVADPNEVDQLEKKSRGWMKVLVLDPTESSSVAPFLRSLSTSLSLRFPLHTSGDPFSRPSHTLALTSVINGLSLSPSSSLCPVEGLEGGDVRKQVGERVETLVKVVQGVLPVMRSASARPGAVEGVFLSLFSSPSLLSPPFTCLPSTATAAQLSLLHSLRRELRATTQGGANSNVRIKILEVGHLSSSAVEGQQQEKDKDLPLRLSNLYAPALARRRALLLLPPSSSSSTANAEAPSSSRNSNRSTHPKKLNQKCFDILVYHRGGVRSSIGVGALSHHLCTTLLPHSFLDALYALQDRVAGLGLYLSPFSRRSLTSAPEATGRGGPLPSPPPPSARGGEGHPESLRPAQSPRTMAKSQVPVDHFGAGAGERGARGASSGYATSEEEEEEEEGSSIDEFGGSLGGGSFTAGGGAGAADQGMGSFVNVERE